jgi:hypothetical protein
VLDESITRETLGCVVKDERDLRHVSDELNAGHFAAMLSLVS